jgi:DNA mismatch repair protein MutS
MSIYEQYIKNHEKYTAIYGKKTIVLCQVGSFFEYYSVENESLKEGPNMSEICTILNIQSTRKNKSIPECNRSNPNMSGFPLGSLKKYTDMLLEEQYTIILIEQVTSPPNPERKVTQIISPGTSLDHSQSFDSNFLMCFYWTIGSGKFVGDFLCLSITFMDITTGETFIYQNDRTGDSAILLQEAMSLLISRGPKELLICYDSTIDKSILSYFDCLPICIKKTETTKPFLTLSYQNTILRKVFQNTGLLSPIEYIDSERNPNMVVCFCYLLDFAYQHNEKIIEKLYKPKIIIDTNYLQLTNQSCEHLDILPKSGRSKNECLLHLLNTCQTAVGKRFFKECLLQPLCNRIEIEKRYNTIESLLENERYKIISQHLYHVKDIERLFRRLSLGYIQPMEMILLLSSLEIISIVGKEQEDLFPCSHFMEQLHNYIEFCNMRWNLSNGENMYKAGVVDEIDQKNNQVIQLESVFKDIVDHVNKLIGAVEFKLETTSEREDYQIIITKKRFETFIATHGNKKGVPVFEAQPLSASNKSVYKVTFPDMEKRQKELHTSRSELRSLIKTTFEKDIAYLQTFSEMIKDVVDYIKYIDVFATSAKNAIKFKYCKPKVIDGDKSFISAKEVRHPLIEIDTAFVANDVELNGENNECGMLLYGVNSSGKSSYMKSVGINLILAQSGFFVASSSFEFSPYHQIFTRIPNGDNLFKRQSTFTGEISELRTILKSADKYSLIIGDEICSSTESISAIAIVSAFIITSSQKQSSFIFASHLNEIQDIEPIKKLENVATFHMSVQYDEISHILTYDRKIKRGRCSSLYGLEVCKSLDMPSEFLLLANTIRQSQLDMHASIVASKTSRYSSEVYMDVCGICKTNKAIETHHKQEQKLADQHGFIGTMHKNNPENLLPLCETCHLNIHSKQEIDENNEIEENIKKLRAKGKSQAIIAKELNITVYKVKKVLQKIL